MSIKLNSVGGGSVTIQEPNTASDFTLSVPAQNGTVVATDASGNVGIGTSSPTQKLQVYSSAASGGQIQVTNSSTGATSTDGVLFGYDGSNDVIVNNQEATATKFYTSGSERMRIASDGAISAGNTTSTVGLGVWSNYGSRIVDFARYADDGAIVGFKRAGTLVGNISVTGSATAYNTSSDYRLKENIAPMTGALAVVGQLKPCTYTWKADGSSGQGFIAHELAEVVPDCVTGEKDATELVDIKDEDGTVIGQETKPVYQGIDVSFLVATLTSAIQEQQAIIAQLQADVAELKGKLA